MPLDDIQGLESIIRTIIHRSLDLGHLLKVCCLGDGKKTEVIRQFAENKFDTNYLPTLGVDITTKQTNFHGLQIKLILVDTASQEFFGKLRPSYYRGASGGILFFDLAQDQATVSTLTNWIGEFQKTTGDVPIALVGLLPDEESSEERSIQNFAKENEMQLFLMNIRDIKTLSLICEELIKLRFTKRKN